MAVAAPDGLSRMRALAAALPDALETGYRSARELARPSAESGARVVAVGMGGSGISADLARGVLDSESRSALSVVRSPDLPRFVDRRTEVLLVSYSGNTWETLAAYDSAGRVGARRTVITSGGELLERAEADGTPSLPVPPGLPPRSTVGHILGGVLGLLDATFPESLESRVKRTAEATRNRIRRYANARGPAAALADKLGDRLPFFYAESAFVGLARRWKTQVEENAKRVAVFDEIPELLHNAIVGWDAIRAPEARRSTAVFLPWAGQSSAVRDSFAYLERLLTSRRVRVLTAPLEADDRLEALVSGISLGDYVSLFLAERRGVDPYPVVAIRRLKEAIGNPAARSARPRRKRRG